MKVLNLDALAKQERQLTIKGTSYPVKEMTVKMFVEITKIAEAVEAKKNKTFADVLTSTTKIVQLSVPTLPSEVLDDLNLEELAFISKFLRGELTEADITGVSETVEGSGPN